MERKLGLWALVAVVLAVGIIWTQGVLQSPETPDGTESSPATASESSSAASSGSDAEGASQGSSEASSRSNTTAQPSSSAAEGDGSFDRLQEVTRLIETRFYDADRVNHQSMETEAIRGLVSALDDPYSRYNTPQEYERFREGLSGEYEGIGAWIGKRNGRIVIISPIEGGPAQAEGVRSGDVILQINGKSTEGFSLEEASRRLRGPKDTEVTITVRREDGTEETITITRDRIKVPSVEHEMRSDGIGYLQISRFNRSTLSEAREALASLRSSASGELKGLILDLRGNGGGLLSASQQVASLFVDRGEPLVLVKQRQRGQQKPTSRGNDLPNWPIAVLVDGATASAAEILAGALRDNQMGALFGRSTFGKGVIQTPLNLDDGGRLILTTGEYFTPDGHKVHEVGLTPSKSFRVADWFPKLREARQEITSLRDSLPEFADSARQVLDDFNEALTDVERHAADDAYGKAREALQAFRSQLQRDPEQLLDATEASAEDPEAVLLPPLLEELRSSIAPKLEELDQRLDANIFKAAEEWLRSETVRGARCPCPFVPEPSEN